MEKSQIADVDILSDLSLQKGNTSLMDLNVELVKRMLTHCNFCRWNCQVDRSCAQTVGDGNELEKKQRISMELVS